MSPGNPAQEAFELWKKALEEGTQAWLRATGQAAAPSAPPPIDLSALWRPLLTQGMEIWQKAAAQGTLTPDFMQQWKALMNQCLETWSKTLEQAMGTEAFAQALGRYLDQWLAAQAGLKTGGDQHTDTALRALGLPSRAQVVAIASQLVQLEERIEGLEERLAEIRTLLADMTRGRESVDSPARPRQRGVEGA